MVNSTPVKETRHGVDLTAEVLLDVLTPLILDLSRDLSGHERYRCLLSSLRALFPGDAAALLRLEGDTLMPLAIDGLSSDTLGRRFRVSEHPRFDTLDMASFRAFLSLAAATVSVVERLDTLARTGEEERRRADAFRQRAAGRIAK